MKRKRFGFRYLVLLVLIGICVNYYLQSPHTVRVFLYPLISYKLEKIAPNVYVDDTVTEARKADLLNAIVSAQKRNEAFFGSQLKAKPVVIAVSHTGFRDLSAGGRTGVAYNFPTHTTIVLSPSGMNVDVLAHELTHAELIKRVGFLQKMRIPTWFDEGLAMQNDYRKDYTKVVYESMINDGDLPPPLQDMDTPAEFNSGSPKRVQLAYLSSKYKVGRWHKAVGKKGLDEFISSISRFESFQRTYDRLEKK